MPPLRRVLGRLAPLIASPRSRPPFAKDATPANYRAIAESLESHLRDVLGKWFPRCVDALHGGFHQDFAEDWAPKPPSDRIVVHQARQTWVAARAALHAPDLADRFAPHALHGLAYLDGPMRDMQHGGPFFFLTPQGKPQTSRGGEKHTCGVVFAIFAAATVYRATREPRALSYAVEMFEWLDAHARDADGGGYFEALARDGTPMSAPPQPGSHDAIGTPYGLKTSNTHIHVLEALAELYSVSPQPLVRARLDEILRLVRDRMTISPGAMNSYFTRHWHALPMAESFGHDVEAAYLMLCAAAALGARDDTETREVARGIIDHALEWGWDRAHGGLYFAGQAFGPPFDRSKIWWVQAENLNSLLLMHECHGGETNRYWKAFLKQLEFIWTFQVDRRHGGWHPSVSENGRARVGDRDKAMQWKAAYHDGRALMNVVETLQRLAESGGSCRPLY